MLLDPANYAPWYDQSLAESLISNGINLHLLTSQFQYGQETNKPYISYTFYPIASRLKARGNFRRLLCGLEHIPGWLRTIKLLKYSTEKVILHTQWLVLPFIDLWFLRYIKSLGVPIVHTVHNLMPHKEGHGSRCDYLQVYGLVDHLIVHTEKTARGLIDEFNIQPKKISIVPHGVIGYSYSSVTRNEALKKLDIQDYPTVLFFGALRKNKGLRYLIAAFGDLLKIIPNSRLMIVGKPDDISEQDIFKWILESEIDQSHIYYKLEYVLDEEIPLFFGAADCVVYPYEKIDQSGALILGMTLGKPVIVTSVGGMPEIVTDHTTGVVIPPRDKRALTFAMRELLQDFDKANKLGFNAREYVNTNLGWDLIGRKTIEIYKGVVNQN